MSSGSRRKSREAALQVLYQVDLNKMTVAQGLETFFGGLAVDPEGERFARSLVQGCLGALPEVDEVIRNSSRNWRIERMAPVDRNVLRLATYELLHCEAIPTRVTLNEAIELAKKFGAEGSAAFVNGVLDHVASTVEAAGDTGTATPEG